jgi:hypothetical protein
MHTLILKSMVYSRYYPFSVMYKFNVLAIARVIVCVALQKYEIESTGNRICEKQILCLN